MPVKTCKGEYLNVPLTECIGKRGKDGKFHVITPDGECGIWMSEAEANEETSKVMEEFLKPRKRRIILD